MFRSIALTVLAGSAFCALSFACEESSDSASPSGSSSGFDGSSGASSGASSSGGSSSGGSSSGGSSGNAGDAGSDGGGDGGITGSAIRLGNLRSIALDICFRQGSTGVPGPFPASQPVFKATSGVPGGSLSQWIPVENKNYAVAYVAAGSQDCSAPIASNNITLAAFIGDVRLTTMIGPSSISGFNQSKASVAGKDNLFVWHDGQNLAFVDADGGASTNTKYRDLTTLEPGLLGQLVRSPASGTRDYKSAVGRVTIMATDTIFAVCDDEAPLAGHLVKCDADVRKP